MAISRSSEAVAEKRPPSASSSDTESVSVVIPCYNEERFIGDALRQLAGQYDNDLLKSSLSTVSLRTKLARWLSNSSGVRQS